MGIRVESVGLFENREGSVKTALELIKRAAEPCIKSQTRYDREDIGVLVSVTVYRDDYFCEPSFANFVQRDLQINHTAESVHGPKTLSFDLLNGAVGFLNGCELSSAMIRAGKAKAGLVVSGDMVDHEINESGAPLGFCFTGAAMLLGEDPDNGAGFDSFYFKTFPDSQEAYESYVFFENKRWSMMFEKDPAIEKIYLDAISRGVLKFLTREGIGIDSFDLILPPQISPGFVSALPEFLGVDRDKIVDVSREDGDLFGASLPTAMAKVLEKGLAAPGQKALIISVGSGVQVGCATYNF
jgi:3-oxoacyl-[acyl-carrier-protein] synthase III